MRSNIFRARFEALTGHSPLSWQERLFHEHFAKNSFPRTIDLPTGLGKTSVIALWLLALLEQPGRIPRRLVYVVNRRTVVDQTTREVERYRQRLSTPVLNEGLKPQCAMELNGNEPPLAISTLRGQFADNQDWSADPSRPAVICGTVDMIGSRLLFEGYRIGFKSRPLHAGFLGQDVLLVHDEAHLEPAFQKLVESIEQEQQREQKEGANSAWPGFRVMALSATARGASTAAVDFSLSDIDAADPVVQQRTEAVKFIRLHSCDDEKKKLVAQIVETVLSEHEKSLAAILVFLRTVDDALEVRTKLEKKHPGKVAPLTGTIRGYERDKLVKCPVFVRFLPELDRPENVSPAEGTVFLVCTSAGEVGVNISADHMVCDLSTFDSMAQRLGRVNRFGERSDTRVDVVHPTSPSLDEKDLLTAARKATLDLLNELEGDASPLNLGNLDLQKRQAAFAPEPTILPATDILFDNWALTTIRDRLPGRPPVAPYLHGVAEWEPPRTSVAWREDVKVISHELIEHYGDDFPQQLLDDYPLKPHELLSDNSERVYKALDALAKRLGNESCPIWLVDEGNRVKPITLKLLLAKSKKDVITRIADQIILLPPWAGGLANGLLDGKSPQADDVADHWMDEQKKHPRRTRFFSDDPQAPGPEGMALIHTIDTDPLAEEFGSEEVSESKGQVEADQQLSSTRGRFWHWYVGPRDSEEATRASLRPIRWNDHTDDVVQQVREIVHSLNWPEEWEKLKQAVILAAELHDLGKRRELWQRSIGNPQPSTWYAKPGKPPDGPRWRPRFLSPYRHEFGSLLDVLDPHQEYRATIEEFDEEMRDVVLHLVAAHHGYARPHFPHETTVDPDHPQSVADEQAIETMRRYSRLQRRYGRWGLAYLESLLRAADWAASAMPSNITSEGGGDA